jgi:hypothetical protein
MEEASVHARGGLSIHVVQLNWQLSGEGIEQRVRQAAETIGHLAIA